MSSLYTSEHKQQPQKYVLPQQNPCLEQTTQNGLEYDRRQYLSESLKLMAKKKQRENSLTWNTRFGRYLKQCLLQLVFGDKTTPRAVKLYEQRSNQLPLTFMIEACYCGCHKLVLVNVSRLIQVYCSKQPDKLLLLQLWVHLEHC